MVYGEQVKHFILQLNICPATLPVFNLQYFWFFFWQTVHHKKLDIFFNRMKKLDQSWIIVRSKSYSQI